MENLAELIMLPGTLIQPYPLRFKEAFRKIAAIISCLALSSSCASGLYLSPEKTKYYGKKVIIYQEDAPTSVISLQMPSIMASEVPFRVISFTEATNLVGKDNWDSNDLSKQDVGLVIMVKDVSFHRDMIRKQPIAQITIGNNPPSWDWVFLSTIFASFTAYDVKIGNKVAEGRFPPESFEDYIAKFGFGGMSVMSPEATFWSEQYITTYVGKHTEYSPYEPTVTNSSYKMADRNAIKKLVFYIAKKIPSQ